jgi:glutamyl-tRNA reductase
MTNKNSIFMYETGPKNISGFFVTGINYRKTDATIRGQFAVSSEQYAIILEKAPEFGIDELFIVSTCNRTEIYGFAENWTQLADLLCTQTSGSISTFRQLAYTKQGLEAISHLLQVGAGLDSQILGDYEIVGQIKQAARIAKQYNRIGAFTERLINCMLQSSKAIKNKTQLSGGTVSVSFAAVQYIRDHINNIEDKQILLLGTGKIGCNTCKNMVDYLNTRNITLINRTEEKAFKLAEELDLRHAPSDALPAELAAADIVLVATNGLEPAILKAQLEGLRDKLIIDLSIPHNVEPAAGELDNITLINVDDLSRMKDETLARREAEVPKAKMIISEHQAEFLSWCDMRQHVPVLKAVKSKLKEIHTSPLFIPLYNHNSRISTDEKIQRVINCMASKMKGQNQKGCHYIEAINDFIATGTN